MHNISYRYAHYCPLTQLVVHEARRCCRRALVRCLVIDPGIRNVCLFRACLNSWRYLRYTPPLYSRRETQIERKSPISYARGGVTDAYGSLSDVSSVHLTISTRSPKDDRGTSV